MKTRCNLISKAMQLACIFSVFLRASVCTSFAAAPVQLGDATLKGTFTAASGSSLISASGSTVNLSLGTVTLPASVSLLGSSISLTSEVTGILPVANGGTGVSSAPTPASQTANFVFSGPATGSAAAPTFRLLDPADIPSIPASKITSGLVPVANGGTGTATPGLVAGSNVTISGAWPNQTIAASGGGGGGSGGDLLSQLLTSETSVTTTATASLGVMHVCSGTTANYTVTLPAASGNAGKLIGIRMASTLTKLVTIAGNGSELIDGSNTRVMWSKESAILLCDGTGWAKIAGRSVAMTCVARPTSNATISSGGSGSYIDLNGAISDPANMLISNRIVIQRPGVYQVNGAVRYETLGSNVNFLASGTCLSRSGSTTQWVTQTTGSALSGCAPHILFSAPYPFIAADIISLFAFQGSGGNLTILGSSSAVTENTWLSVTELPTW